MGWTGVPCVGGDTCCFAVVILIVFCFWHVLPFPPHPTPHTHHTHHRLCVITIAVPGMQRPMFLLEHGISTAVTLLPPHDLPAATPTIVNLHVWFYL